MCGGTAHSHFAGIVVPAHSDIVHPPDLWLTSDSKTHSDNAEIVEGWIESNRCQSTINKRWTSIDSHDLRCNSGIFASGSIMTESSEGEYTRWSLGITTNRTTIEVESETPGMIMITISNIPRKSAIGSVWSTCGCTILYCEVWNEFCHLGWRGWKIWIFWWRYNDISVRKVELMIGTENGLRVNVIGTC